MKSLVLSAIRQYKESCRVVGSPDSYLPKTGREVGRFPTLDMDVVSRFWIVLPSLLVIDLALSPYWIYRLVRKKW